MQPRATTRPHHHEAAPLAGLGMIEVVLGDPDKWVQRWVHRSQQAALEISGERPGDGDPDEVLRSRRLALPFRILHPDHEKPALGVGEGRDVFRELLLGACGEGAPIRKGNAFLVVHRRSLADATDPECPNVGAGAQLVEELNHPDAGPVSSATAKTRPIR